MKNIMILTTILMDWVDGWTSRTDPEPNFEAMIQMKNSERCVAQYRIEFSFLRFIPKISSFRRHSSVNVKPSRRKIFHRGIMKKKTNH